MKNKIAAFRAQLATAETFADKFSESLGGMGNLNITGDFDGIPVFSLYIFEHDPDHKRAAALIGMGKTFGTDGWSAKMNGSYSAFDWFKNVDGVKVIIYGAALPDKRDTIFPVPPSAFPIQLEDVKPAGGEAPTE